MRFDQGFARGLFATVLAAASSGGCWGGTSTGDGAQPQAQSNGAPVAGDGKLFIDWTLGGAPPSTASCARVDHLQLTLAYSDGSGVDIAPIPCTLTRFRYDNLPEGDATVEIDALDGSGCPVATGQAALHLAPTIPAAPSPTI